MAVIINDFELILDSPASDQAAATAPQAAPPVPKPEDVARMAAHLAARDARVEAD